MGPPRPAARGDAQPAPADAAARPEHRRLHAIPERGDRRLRHRGGCHRHRHLPHLRRPQRRGPDASGHRRRAGHRHRGGRGRPVLHRRPHQPRREALHPRLLPAAGRADRRGRRAHHRHQGHGRAAAGPCRPHARHGAAGAVRPAGAPAHPRHGRRTAGHAPGGDRRGRRRRRRGERRPVGHHQPAPDVQPRRGDRRDVRKPPASTCRRCATSSPTGRPCASCTSRSSPACRRRPGASTPTRSPVGQLSNLRQQAIALGLGDHFEAVEDMYAAANRILGNIVKVTPSSKVVGDLALAASIRARARSSPRAVAVRTTRTGSSARTQRHPSRSWPLGRAWSGSDAGPGDRRGHGRRSSS